MKAFDYVAQELLRDDVSYHARYKDQPTILTSVRLPIEIIARIDALKHRGLGTSRSAVLQVLFDVGFEQILNLPGFDDAELIEEVEAGFDDLQQNVEASE
jgi:hypothetical protein